jgi:hypothetical protein
MVAADNGPSRRNATSRIAIVRERINGARHLIAAIVAFVMPPIVDAINRRS